MRRFVPRRTDRPGRADGRRQDQDRPPPRRAGSVCRSSIRTRRSKPRRARPIEEIFANRGERVFRDGERRVIARLLATPVHVLATGGGAFMDPATRAVIRAARRVVVAARRSRCAGAAGVAPQRPAAAEGGRSARDPGRADRAAPSDLCRGRPHRRQRRRARPRSTVNRAIAALAALPVAR